MLRGVIATNITALPQIPLDADEISAVRAVLVREGVI
jgi:hypothetical protein